MKHPNGWITFLGVCLVSSTLVHMQTLIFNYDWYVHNFTNGYMPVWLANCRYIFSWLQRLAGLYAGVGLFWRKPSSRWVAIGIGIFTIATLYWKHPYPAFYHHAQYLEEHYGALYFNGAIIHYVDLVLPALIVHFAADILFNGWMIYILTRTSVKEQFA